MSAASLKTFIIYARADEAHKKRLLLQLRPLVNAGLIDVWHDGEILPGESWEQRIMQELKASQLVLMLVSAHSLNSAFIQDKEFKVALEKTKSGQGVVVPVVVDHCAWQWDPVLSGLQALPAFEGKGIHPVTDTDIWKNENKAWTVVVNDIGRLVTEYNQKAQEKAQPKQQADTQALEAQKAPRPPQPENIVLPPPPAQKETAPDMVLVKGGSFQMGSNDYDNEKPIHTVWVADFYMGRCLVTLAEFRAFIKATGHTTDAEKKGYNHIWTGGKREQKNGINWRHNVQGQPATDTHPVIHVSWNDAVAYCAWLNEVLPAGQKVYRLPTEAEWEYAARGGEHRDEYRYAGSDNIDEVAWYRDNSNMATHPVGQKKANALGLHDMSGLVWEWCSDWYGADYYKNSPADNPKGPTSGSFRVVRGGSWYDYPRYCRVAVRYYYAPGVCGYDIGFRLFRTR
jgi:formylglycine-generating enzyme required for sulfatase activity